MFSKFSMWAIIRITQPGNSQISENGRSPPPNSGQSSFRNQHRLASLFSTSLRRIFFDNNLAGDQIYKRNKSDSRRRFFIGVDCWRD
ncbi:unnamed protein product, partial [Mesorhabditis belari]|uniref:Uncharacterized protein n=1 Tax=Mesorhabditis belari TaxID=2138241 RepID=A0AAF3J389_9BILA